MRVYVNLTRPQLESLFAVGLRELRDTWQPSGHPNDPDRVLLRALEALTEAGVDGGTIHDQVGWEHASEALQRGLREEFKR